MITDITKSLSAYRMDKAKALLNQAELLLVNHQYDGSINRSYYAIFNAVRSILALVHLDSRSHQGVISFFDRYFVKTRLFDKEYSRMIHEAFDTRQENDYEDFYVPTEADAKEQLYNAKQVVKEIELKKDFFIQGTLSLPAINEKS